LKAEPYKGNIMALIPLNTFKTKTAILGSNSTSTVYTAPVGVTSIVLMAQVANLSTGTQTLNFVHHRNRPVLADAQGNGAQAGNVDSPLVKDFQVPANDAASVLTGKLIIESLDSIRAYSGTTGTLQLTLSILESANE
jgi:hypothetical protein